MLLELITVSRFIMNLQSIDSRFWSRTTMKQMNHKAIELQHISIPSNILAIVGQVILVRQYRELIDWTNVLLDSNPIEQRYCLIPKVLLEHRFAEWGRIDTVAFNLVQEWINFELRIESSSLFSLLQAPSLFGSSIFVTSRQSPQVCRFLWFLVQFLFILLFIWWNVWNLEIETWRHIAGNLVLLFTSISHTPTVWENVCVKV